MLQIKVHFRHPLYYAFYKIKTARNICFVHGSNAIAKKDCLREASQF